MAGEVGLEPGQTVVTETEVLEALQAEQCFPPESLNTVVVQSESE